MRQRLSPLARRARTRLRQVAGSVRKAIDLPSTLAVIGTVAGARAGFEVWSPLGWAVICLLCLYGAVRMATARAAAQAAARRQAG